MLRKAYDSLKPLLLKGQAVDSDGNPLEGVKIQISWSTAGFLIGLPMDHNKTTWVTSNKKGEWTFKLDKPDQVSIRTAQKDGYAFDLRQSLERDMVVLGGQRRRSEYPSTVVMRKKMQEVLLLGNDNNSIGELYLWAVQGKGKQVNVDILADYENRKNPEYTDLRISVSFDSTNACWTLTFMAPDGYGGLINRTEQLFEAPKAEYVQEVAFKVAIKDRVPEENSYLYLRSRKQGLYTRVKYNYDFREVPEDGLIFRVYLVAVTNPYGERSFEDATGLRKYIFAQDEMIEDAKKAIRSGTLPKKPENLEKHLQERNKILEDQWRNPNR